MVGRGGALAAALGALATDGGVLRLAAGAGDGARDRHATPASRATPRSPRASIGHPNAAACHLIPALSAMTAARRAPALRPCARRLGRAERRFPLFRSSL